MSEWQIYFYTKNNEQNLQLHYQMFITLKYFTFEQTTNDSLPVVVNCAIEKLKTEKCWLCCVVSVASDVNCKRGLHLIFELIRPQVHCFIYLLCHRLICLIDYPTLFIIKYISMTSLSANVFWQSVTIDWKNV